MARKFENNPLESDNEMEFECSNEVITPPETTNRKRYVLYVPYEYKDDCKMLGGKFDKDTREWYVEMDADLDYKQANDNIVDLIDTFHKGNFYMGRTMNKYLITLEKHEKRVQDKIERMKSKFVKYYPDQNFDEWYKNNVDRF